MDRDQEEIEMRGFEVLAMLLDANQLLRTGRRYGLRIVATPAALAGIEQLAAHHGEAGRALYAEIATNVVSTDHVFEPEVFPGIQLRAPTLCSRT